jgi:hypothetical protein
VKSKTASQDEVSFFRAGGVVLALWGREAQRDDANAGALWNGNGGMVVAQNVAKQSRGRCCYGKGRGFGCAHLEIRIQDLLGRLWPTLTVISGRSPSTRIGGLDEDGLIELPK